MSEKFKINWNLIIGLFVIIFNTYLIFDSLYLIYLYHFTSILFMFMYPDWVLVLNAILGLLGIFIGWKILNRKLRIIKWFLIDFFAILTGFVIKTLIIM